MSGALNRKASIPNCSCFSRTSLSLAFDGCFRPRKTACCISSKIACSTPTGGSCARGHALRAPQVFDLSHYLIRNRERVVSKDDLIAAIWNGRIVSDAALTTRLNVARSRDR